MNSEFEKVESLVGDYLSWLKQEIQFTKVNEAWTMITLPFVYKIPYIYKIGEWLQVDCLHVYVKRHPNGQFFLTDNGETINNLEKAGVHDGVRGDVGYDIYWLARSNGAEVNGNFVKDNETDKIQVKSSQICLTITEDKFPRALNTMIQAMLEVSQVRE